MELLIVRHAEAAPGDPDELRPLTRGGRDQARALGTRFREEGVRPAAILTSPLLQAREVLHGISFEVRSGEVFALLGPNGAGKTTTVEILEGYRRRDGGDVRVLGADPEHGGSKFRARIGIVLQSSALYHLLSVREIVELFAGY